MSCLHRSSCAMLFAAAGFFVGGQCLHGEEKSYWSTGAKWPEPRVVDPGTGGGAPSDAIVLFDGKDLSAWDGAETWKIHDGYVTCGTADLKSKQAFGDCQLHLEWAEPADIQGK